MNEHTTVKLANALSVIPGVPEDMIQRAKAGLYHDFLSPLDYPELKLLSDLQALADTPATPRDSRRLLRDMAQRVMNGEFDASAEEAREWAESPEGRETFRQLADDIAFANELTRDIEGR